MCQCTPEIRTPWCGRGDCVPPPQRNTKILKLSEIMEILNKELKWCIDNPDNAFHNEYRKGFQNGLIQAKYLISELAKLPGADDGD